MVVGHPARIIRQVSDEMMAWKAEGTKLCQQLPQQCFQTLKSCDPLTEEIAQAPFFTSRYQPFKKAKLVRKASTELS